MYGIRLTIDRCVAGSTPGRAAASPNFAQVVHTRVPLSSNSMIYYWSKNRNIRAGSVAYLGEH